MQTQGPCSWPRQQPLPKLVQRSTSSTIAPSAARWHLETCFLTSPPNSLQSSEITKDQQNLQSWGVGWGWGFLWWKNALEKSLPGKREMMSYPLGGEEGGLGDDKLLCWEGSRAERRGKCIVLVSFKCDQCFGFQGRTWVTKNNQEVEPRAQRLGGGRPG